jgi:uncharacterized protein
VTPTQVADKRLRIPGEGSFGPVPKAERIAGIGFIRGLALLGILLVNAPTFFAPVAPLFDPALVKAMPFRDRAAHLLVVSLCQGKFISIFSMLFGYGLLGQIEKAAAARRSPGRFVLRRLGVLGLFGVGHAVAIWYGDVLFLHAVCGGWLLLARGASGRSLLLAAGWLLALAFFLRAGLEMVGAATGEEIAKGAAGELPSPPPRGLEAMARAGFYPASPIWMRAEVEAYRDGPWIDAEVFRVVEWIYLNLGHSLLYGGWQVLGMFFLGAALWRWRFFSPEKHPLRRRVFVVCLLAGVALEGVAGYLFWAAGPADRLTWHTGGAVQGLAVCSLPVGYLAGLALLADRLPGWVISPVVSAGRMALTVYLLESVAATALAYHWGMGWFGRVGALYQVLLSGAIWAGLVVGSWLWLLRFDRGPAGGALAAVGVRRVFPAKPRGT